MSEFTFQICEPPCSNETVEGLATKRVGLQDPAVSDSGSSHPFVILHLTSHWQDSKTMKNLIDSNNLICLEGMVGLEKHTHTHTSLSLSLTHTHTQRSCNSDQSIDRFSWHLLLQSNKIKTKPRKF